MTMSMLVANVCMHVQCLAAGSSIMNREVESASMRPLAKTLTRHLDSLRSQLREQCFRNQNKFTDKVLLSSAQLLQLTSTSATISSVSCCVQCFDAVGWISGMASSL